MKPCLICHHQAEDLAPTCVRCGEGSWGEMTENDVQRQAAEDAARAEEAALMIELEAEQAAAEKAAEEAAMDPVEPDSTEPSAPTRRGRR